MREIVSYLLTGLVVLAFAAAVVGLFLLALFFLPSWAYWALIITPLVLGTAILLGAMVRG